MRDKNAMGMDEAAPDEGDALKSIMDELGITVTGDVADAQQDDGLMGDDDDLEGLETDENGDIIIALEEGSVDADKAMELALLGWNDNVASVMEPNALRKIGADLKAAVEADDDTCAPWHEMYDHGVRLLGLTIEEKTWPFKGACSVTDPMLIDAVVRAQAQIYGEILPAEGPVKIAEGGNADEAVMAAQQRVSAFMNHYLTDVQEDYYEDMDQALLIGVFAGDVIKKVYEDPLQDKPVSYYIPPKDFIINYGTRSVRTATRATHRYTLAQAAVKEMQAAGEFLEDAQLQPIQLGGVDDDRDNETDQALGLDGGAAYSEDRDYLFYEVHTVLVIEELQDAARHELPCPYIVTLDATTGTVVSLKRNWSQNDLKCKKLHAFVQHKMLQGLGSRGWGMVHLLANRTDFKTKIMRQTVDANTMAMFRPMARTKGMRLTSNNFLAGPGEWVEIDTMGQTLTNSVMPIPYEQPSQLSLEMYREIDQGSKSIIGATEIGVGEGRSDAPVGTTLALIEAALKVMTGSMKRIHATMRREFGMIKDLLADWIETSEQGMALAAQMGVTPMDMRNTQVIPVSDPNIASDAQRMLKAQAVVQAAQMLTEAAPPHMIEAMRFAFRSFGIPNPDKYLPKQKPQAMPLDPVTENMNATMGLPLKAGLDQNHQAHMQVHMVAQGATGMMAHIQEHAAMQMRIDFQQKMGMMIPEGQLPPELENAIAMKAAQVSQQLMPKGKDGEGEMPMSQVMMADIAQKAKAAADKVRVEEMKVQQDAYKLAVTQSEGAANRAAKMEVKKIDAVTKLMTDDSSAGQALPPEVR
jgi:hypothetical protein